MSTQQSYTKALPVATGSTGEIFETPESIKIYFEKVRSLLKSGNQYPVNLNDVWPLCYSYKEVAVRALRKQFIEGLDYQSLDKNVKREIGATTTVSYSLSVPCMEFFVARKVRSVFEVYREVFHRVADIVEQKPVQCECGTSLAKLEKKIDSLEKIHNLYIVPKIVKCEIFESEDLVMKKKLHTDIMTIVIDLCKRITVREPERHWKDIFDGFAKDFNVDIRRFPRRGSEHLVDVAIRLGYGVSLWEYVSYACNRRC
ncbi:hypothetical protein [Larkinella terrae]|uniref:Uncharacterized protein n=1 Tax=Larkinella terrae TaxID=2025311 RepID=A0A7K0EIX2_9BACT|nr:hypothetical protein [Larkinella terrae]MRS61793.1 hypothetical protein [Larkinella terrae]